MNDDEQKQFEAQLRQCSPARLPEQLMARIFTGQSCVQTPAAPQPRNPAGLRGWFEMLRWLAPAAAAAIVFAVWLMERPRNDKPAPGAAVRADGVQLDQRLVSSFDAVAQLPSGQPIRFRVQKWQDQLALEDKERGLVVKESAPRWEVVPIRIETY